MSNPENLTDGWLLARNTVFNFVGEAAPFLVAIVALPALIRGMGVDRYGILSLSAMVVGYFGIFDFGLGRAATKLIAEAAASGNGAEIPGLFWTALFLMFALGGCGMGIVAATSPWTINHLLKIPVALRRDTLRSFYMLALSLPFVISAGSLSGTLSAFQRFDLINAVRAPVGIFSYLGPLLVLPFSHRLEWLVAAMVAVRVISWVATLSLCLKTIPGLCDDLRPSQTALWPLLSFGGWVTVSNIIGPITAYFDRFLIGAILSMAAVAYYSVPYQVAVKVWIVPGAFGGVAFAAFSASFKMDSARAALLFERATRYIVLAVFPAILIMVTLAPEGLTMWLGAKFAANSAGVFRWLAIGVFVNCAAWTSLSLIQAAHRPDIVAKLYIAQLPPYVAVVWYSLNRWGVEGVAIAWSIRAGADAILLLCQARRLLPLAAGAVNRTAKTICAGLMTLAFAAVPMDLIAKELYLVAVLALFALLCWAVLLEPEEKVVIRAVCRGACIFGMSAAE